MEETARTPSNFGNKRRNSSATAARLRTTDGAVGWVIGTVTGGLKSKTVLEQNKNKAKTVPRPRRVFNNPVLPIHNYPVMDFGMHATSTSAASDALFKSLADPTRRALFERLCRDGEQTVAALTAQAGVSQPAVSKHLAVLKQAGLVRDRHEGRQTHYSAQRGALAPLIGWTSQMTGFWENRFDRLEDLLNRMDQ
jgi:DNA-binding transcriptional ArsR family regulator